MVLVGDRGMLTQTQIEALKKYPGLGWISALRFSAVRNLAGNSLEQWFESTFRIGRLKPLGYATVKGSIRSISRPVA